MPFDRCHVRWRTVAELSAADLQDWEALEARAIEPNAFLSPHFVLPALQYLDPESRTLLAWIELESQGLQGGQDHKPRSSLVGVAVLQRSLGTRTFPWPHLVSYQSRHSYLGGLLVDEAYVGSVAQALQQQMRSSAWGGLALARTDGAGPLAQALTQEMRAQKLKVYCVGPQERAMLDMAQCGEALVRQTLGKKINEINRCMRRLGELGPVTWHCHRQITPEVIEAFLDLEHQGWKGEVGSSLRASPADEAFFCDTVARFNQSGRALFTELRLDGRPIASTCNFVSGRMGFAFKVGWDPTLRKFGPGMLNEIEFIRQGGQFCRDLSTFDSGASADSFINKLWPQRRSLGSVLLPAGKVAAGVLRQVQALRDLRHAHRRSAPEPVTSASTNDVINVTHVDA